MRIFEWIGLGVMLAVLSLAALYIRRQMISRRGGTIEVCFRLYSRVPGRGWSPGIAAFSGEQMRWYRVFSLSPRPSRSLHRRRLVVRARRAPEPAELVALSPDWVILICDAGTGAQVEMAMAPAAVTGFLSWIEAAPPGGASIRFAAS